MTDTGKIRAAFEAKYGKMPAHCIWTGKGYAQTEYHAYAAQLYSDQFDGFKDGYIQGQRDLIEAMEPVAYQIESPYGAKPHFLAANDAPQWVLDSYIDSGHTVRALAFLPDEPQKDLSKNPQNIDTSGGHGDGVDG